MYRERIRENYERLSKSQKRIADFLMTSHRDAAFMTASRLAIVLKVDVATITRFAQRLHYPGYPELLEEVRTVVQAEMDEGFKPVEGATEAGRAFVHTLNIIRDNLERTLSNISMEAVEKSVNALAKAHTVYILGQHTSTLLAAKLAIRLQVLGVPAEVVGGDTAQVALAIRNLQKDDVVIGIGLSGYATDVASVLRIAHDVGATTIAISGSDVSPVARSADITLVCFATSPMYLPSEVAASSVIEGIAQALVVDRNDTYNANVTALGDMFQKLVNYRVHPVGSIEESIMKLY